MFDLIVSDIMMPGVDEYMVKPIDLDELFLRITPEVLRLSDELLRLNR